MIVKHFVDKHNIYFVYGPCLTPKQEIHGLASNLLMLGNYLAQFTVAAYCITQAYFHQLHPKNETTEEKDRFNRGLIFYAILTLVLTLAPYFLHCCCGFCPSLMPVFYRVRNVPKLYLEH